MTTKNALMGDPTFTSDEELHAFNVEIAAKNTHPFNTELPYNYKFCTFCGKALNGDLNEIDMIMGKRIVHKSCGFNANFCPKYGTEECRKLTKCYDCKFIHCKIHMSPIIFGYDGGAAKLMFCSTCMKARQK
jgi:hypothetical protein